MNQLPQIILSIESAIAGGSISLLRDGREIAGWTGTSNVSKAEDLLPNIDSLLSANDISPNEINLIAVSAGPGSFTGIRIGIATALGLKNGLGIKMVTVPVLKAMAFAHSTTFQKIYAAVPTGRNAVCIQSFSSNSSSMLEGNTPISISEPELIERVKTETDQEFLLHSSLYELVETASNTLDAGKHLARSIGVMVSQNPNEASVEPLFISKSF